MLDQREERQQLFDNYTGKKDLLAWSWLQYTRYRKADPLLKTLQDKHVNIANLQVTDYGCGVGDYGFVFGRAGAKVVFYDFKEQIDFVKYRVDHEPINAEFLYAPTDIPIANPSFVIFGEVLEHVANPPEILQFLIDSKVPYLYTSSYPYRSDDPNDHYWQKSGHRHEGLAEMQKPCRELLNANYDFVQYDGEARLWTLK